MLLHYSLTGHDRSSSLPSLLCADESNDARQLSALCKLLLFCLLIHIFASSNVVADFQHPVLERQKLGESIVEEGCGKGDVGRRLAGVWYANVELPRGLSLLLWCLHCWGWRRLRSNTLLVYAFVRERVVSYFSRSTKVMFSAISATRFAIREAMMVYGEAWCCAPFAAPFAVL